MSIVFYGINTSWVCLANTGIIGNDLIKNEQVGVCTLGKPKKRTTPRRTGTRRSHLVVKLARSVNAKSPVNAYTTRRESGKAKAE